MAEMIGNWKFLVSADDDSLYVASPNLPCPLKVTRGIWVFQDDPQDVPECTIRALSVMGEEQTYRLGVCDEEEDWVSSLPLSVQEEVRSVYDL